MNTELHNINTSDDSFFDVTRLPAHDVESGDVIEIDRNGEPVTVLVLLTTETALILDALDGSTPFVVQAEELGEFRKYEPAL